MRTILLVTCTILLAVPFLSPIASAEPELPPWHVCTSQDGEADIGVYGVGICYDGCEKCGALDIAKPT